MKNIHILATEKPSRLYEFGGNLILTKTPETAFRNKNIYITSSDEEIKEGYYYDLTYNIVMKSSFYQSSDKNCKKVILTTDPELIKDGIQAIPDDFLEWFVKNPSCEFVVTQKWDKSLPYLIFIPKEEPKQVEIDWSGFPRSTKDKVGYVELKQEKLEEASKSHAEQNKNMFSDKNFIIWLFDNYKKNKGTLFYHKFDHSNVKTYYDLDDLLKIYNETL